MKYLQVCLALYDYQARTPDEISIAENDILYVVNMDDDDWWKAEIKQVSGVHSGLIGLVPATYLEEVSPVGKVRAEYDYEAQQEEEISFGEGQELWLLEQDDPDWYLVKLEDGCIGLAPSNYVQVIDNSTNQQQQQMENTTALPTPNMEPSPITNATTSPQQPIQNQHTPKDIQDEAQSWTVHEYDVAKKKKRKGKGNFLVGNSMLCYGSETDKTSPVQQYHILDLTKYLLNGKNIHIEIDGRNPAVLDLQASSKSEAKAILVKMTDSRKMAQQMVTHISQQESTTTINNNNISGSINTTTTTNGAATEEPRWAISLYAFGAEGGEEISIGENEQILVTDCNRDDGWWRVTTADGKKSGIIPSSYIQFHDDNGDGGDAVKNQDRLPGKLSTGDDGVDSAASDEVETYMQRKQATDQHMEEQNRRMDQQTRDEQERERRRRVKEAAQFAEATRQQHMENERMRKESSTRSSAISSNTSSDIPCSTSGRQTLPKPDPDRLRTWTDRSGTFRVEAQFLGYTNGKLRLHKANGVKIDVPLEKMSAEDIRWVERRTDQPVGSIAEKLNHEKAPEMPTRPTPSDEQRDKSGSAKGRKSTSNSHWDWFDWFMKIGIPMQEALVYSSAFKADNLDDGDITRLTHKQMKILGMKEKHVQRMERYIDTGNIESHSDGEEVNTTTTRQNDVNWQTQIETDEEMARRLQKSWNENGELKVSSTTTKPSGSQNEIHPDLLDFLGSGSSPNNNEQPIKNTTGIHSDLIGFNNDAWALRPVKDIPDSSQNQQAQYGQKIDQHTSSQIDMTMNTQQSPSLPAPGYPQTTSAIPSASTQQTTISQQSKSIDPTLLQWQSSPSNNLQQSENHQKLSLNELSQQEQLRKHQQQQRQQSLLDQQQQIIMQQQQQIQQQQIHQQQIQLQQQQQQQNQLLQQATGYQQPNLIMHNQGPTAIPSQMTGYIQHDQMMTGYFPQQQLQITGGQTMYQPQQPPTQPISTTTTGHNWNFSTPDNPFGSPPPPPLQTTGDVQFSTPNLNAFTQNPTQPSSSSAYLQQLQPQMTGIQQTELSGARDKYAAFRTPTMDVFTQSGSMQHGSQNTQQYQQHW